MIFIYVYVYIYLLYNIYMLKGEDSYHSAIDVARRNHYQQ